MNLRFVAFIALFLWFFICRGQPGGFTYSGTPFTDPDWGRSYRTAAQDRDLLRHTDSLMKLVLNGLIRDPGDYSMTITDMRFIFDTLVQKENAAKGNPCVTCIYSSSPAQGRHLSYINRIRLEIQEGSATDTRKRQQDDSLNAILQSDLAGKRKAAGSEEREADIRKEAEALRKEIEKIDPAKLDEKTLAEITRESKAIGQKAEKDQDAQKLDEDHYHDLYGKTYNPVITVLLETNVPLYAAERKRLMAMKNDPGYYFRELTQTGCDLALIGFDRYGRSDDLPDNSRPFLVTYCGNIYPDGTSLPRPWVKPFCVKLTFSGNLEQIDEIKGRIDFGKMREIVK
jgi:hypothetical protein